MPARHGAPSIVRMPGEILVTRRIPAAGVQSLASAGLSFDVNPHDRPMTREELIQAVEGRRGVISLVHDRIDGALLAAAGSQLRIIANMAVGYDNIDLAAAAERRIFVTNTPDVLTETTADLAFALILATARRVGEGDRLVRSGRWAGWGPLEMLGRDVHGATLGILGAGRIGSAVGKRAVGFGMTVLYSDPLASAEMEELGGERVELDRLLDKSDFLSIHVSLNERTHHLIGAQELARMKPSACLVNTARGSVIDEAALVEALRRGRPGCAGLDVYEREPALTPGLTDLDNVVLLPHLGSASERTRGSMARLAAENVIAALAGERPPNLVHPNVGDKA